MGTGQFLTYLHLSMTFAVVVTAAAVEVSLSGFTVAQPDGGRVGPVETARHIIGGGTGRREAGSELTGARVLFGGLAWWLACFLALRVVVVGLRRLGAAGWATASVVAALALGAVKLGAVRVTELFIFAGSLLLALAALGSLLNELRRRRTVEQRALALAHRAAGLAVFTASGGAVAASSSGRGNSVASGVRDACGLVIDRERRVPAGVPVHAVASVLSCGC